MIEAGHCMASADRLKPRRNPQDTMRRVFDGLLHGRVIENDVRTFASELKSDFLLGDESAATTEIRTTRLDV